MDKRHCERLCVFGKKGLSPTLSLDIQGSGIRYILRRSGQSQSLLDYFEWFYRSRGADVGFGSDQIPSPDTSLRVHTYNSPIVMDLAQADAAICPTIGRSSVPASNASTTFNFDEINIENVPLIEQEDRNAGLDIHSSGIEAVIRAIGHVCN